LLDSSGRLLRGLLLAFALLAVPALVASPASAAPPPQDYQLYLYGPATGEPDQEVPFTMSISEGQGTLTMTYPAGMTYVRTEVGTDLQDGTTPDATCTHTATSITCETRYVQNGGDPNSVSVYFRTSTEGSYTATANFTASGAETDPSNNTATQTVQIATLYTDLSVSNTADPATTTVGSTVNFNALIKNGGEYDSDAGFSESFAGQDVLSVTPSQGTCQTANTVTCQLGPIQPGGSALVVVKARQQVAGTVSNTATVSSSRADSESANNSATATTVVSPGEGTTFTTPRKRVPLAGIRNRTTRRDHSSPRTFISRGSLTLPAGVTREDGCRGRVSVSYKAGRNTISTRYAKVDSDCHYRSRITFGLDRRFFGRSRLKVQIRFGGNSALYGFVKDPFFVGLRAAR
jgi:hypothetical protein